MQAYRNAQRVTQVSLSDRAFLYGDGCFTTAKIVNNHVQLLQRHIQRLQRACAAMSLDANLGYIQQSLMLLQQESRDSHAAALNGVLKIMLSRGLGTRGYAMPTQAADVYVMFFAQAGMAQDSVQMIDSGLLTRKMGLTMPELCGIKTLNRLEQVILKQEAQQRGWPEALVCDIQGNVVEGVSGNCFILMDGQWITPDLAYNGISGVMRAEIIARMQKLNIPHAVRRVSMAELPYMQGLFYCNALQTMQAVDHFDGRKLDLQAAFTLFEQLNLQYIE